MFLTHVKNHPDMANSASTCCQNQEGAKDKKSISGSAISKEENFRNMSVRGVQDRHNSLERPFYPINRSIQPLPGIGSPQNNSSIRSAKQMKM